ncbi:PspC domain-containing protein [Chryseobacterium sp. SNU WT5]|uniref:PspC domain-containing protein n=1 Tax=Chryseobacterium sp. SNU WT5 TaxID=2594269 RepID=UPI001180700A|nr:PspC domain-containing protein [Chryseobacterium sp. SNU WT5]QDP84519.1 PspC domain-containing protein [Chryseobacterium sp. SNU WT5]
MNKTLSIGLAGFSFTIEEHAYIKLSDYLAALKSSLDVNEAEEVMHDIEIRMVEIFNDLLGKREVINDTDVEKVIAQIGSPEKIEEQEEAYFSDNTSSKKREQRSSANFSGNKQLYRDPEKQKIAGVCAGLAHYVGMDVTAMRAIWLGIAIIGIFTAISTMIIVLIYIILWIVLPKAETASDFLKMKGKPMNFDNLKEESTKIVQFANESTQRVGEIYNENKPYIHKAGSGLWNLVRYSLGGIFGLMALGCIVGAFFIFGIFGTPQLPGVPGLPGMNEFNFYFSEVGTSNAVFGMMLLGTLIPAILFSLLSIKLISPKTQLRNVGYVLGALVLLLFAFATYFGVSMAKQDLIFKGHKEDIENVAINAGSDSLYIDVKQVTIPQSFTAYDDDIYSDKKTVFEEDYPSVEVTRKSNINAPYLIIKKEGKGYNVPVQLNVPVEIQGNKILLPNYVKYPYEHRFRNYNVNYELVVPQNFKIFKVRDNVLQLDDDSSDDSYDDDYSNHSGISIEKNKIRINGSTIEYNSNDKDSVIINNKKVSKDQAEDVIDSIGKGMKKMKNVDIVIKDGKKEVSIKTK